jgi:hypothetical protein
MFKFIKTKCGTECPVVFTDVLNYTHLNSQYDLETDCPKYPVHNNFHFVLLIVTIWYCARFPPMDILFPCVAQYSTWDLFGLRERFIESDTVYFWLNLSFYFITIIYLFTESA